MMITQAQVAAMDQDAENGYIRRMVEFAVDEHGEERSDPLLHDRCKGLIRQALGYNFRSELEIATFVSCGFAYGPGFDEQADLPFAEILSDVELDVEFKAERMAEVLDRQFDEDVQADGAA